MRITPPSSRRPGGLVATLTGAALATGLLAASASAQSPMPPVPTPTPTPTPPAGPVYCIDPPPGPTRASYTLSELTPTSAAFDHFFGFGCFATPIRTTYALDGDVLATVEGFSGSYTFVGLEPGSTHRVKITGYEPAREGQAGRTRVLADLDVTTPLDSTPEPTPTPTPVPTPTPTPEPTPWPSGCVLPSPLPTPVGAPSRSYRFGASGSVSLKTLTKAALPLSGSLTIQVEYNTSCFEGDLTLASTRANLTALGFLPVVADLQIVPTGQMVGTARDGIVDARFRLPKVSLFGLRIGGGATCQTKKPSAIDLRSTQPGFVPRTGGPVSATFAIGDFVGCGVLSGTVVPRTAGSGAIQLELAPITG